MVLNDKVWKAWEKIVAKAWFSDKFKEYFIDQPEKVLQSEGIIIPPYLKVNVEEELESDSLEPWKPIKLTIPCKVPITIPEGIEVKVERKFSPEAIDGTPESLKLIISLEISGVIVELNDESDVITLTLRLPKRPSETEFLKEKIEKVMLGLEDFPNLYSGNDKCPPPRRC